ncbi:MAG: hypothetical protein IJX47_07085 [Clostridia bacterium]|nr:hypothetical protein [Clostridia bacterium]
MKNTLIDLWNGNLSLNEYTIHSEEAKQLIGYLEKHHSALSVVLNESGKESLRRFADCYDELLELESENAFVQGFSLAAKLFTEALT